MNILRTAAPRSSVVHAVDGRPGVSLHQTMCGTRIGDEWEGEYTAEPTGEVSCRRCLPLLAVEIAAEEERMSAAAKFGIGERVGIVTGVQSVTGPTVTHYGTVVGHRAPWGEVEYIVKLDDVDGADGSELLYRAYLLRPTAPLTGTDFLTGETMSVDIVSTDTLTELLTGNPWKTARARSMAAHPAGKGRKIVRRQSVGPVTGISVADRGTGEVTVVADYLPGMSVKDTRSMVLVHGFDYWS